MAMAKQRKFRLMVLCGGISAERGISLNSARSVCDHLDGDAIDIQPIYFDHRKRAYLISRAALYSNTPSDFDFKLQRTSSKLSQRALIRTLKSADMVFPAIHGAFGEDGELQRFLEQHNIRFTGSTSIACKRAFNKHTSNELLRANNFFALPSLLLKSHESKATTLKHITNFFKTHKLKRAIIKPVCGGSSIGVHSVTTPSTALAAAEDIFNKKQDTQAVCEPFCEGKEFTVIILQNRFGMPVSIIPTEIETSYDENQIFDYRKKYLATRKVRYHCPPRFTEDQIETIQAQAEQLFNLIGMRHFARFDGWILRDGRIWFSDFNPISGMEQNSFLFQQASQIGMSHRDILTYIIKRACADYGIQTPKSTPALGTADAAAATAAAPIAAKKQRVNIIGGGISAERQVSLMSATNVWLKLRQSKKYYPELYLLATGPADKVAASEIWHVPYNFALNHTVEEILDACRNAHKNAPWLERHRARAHRNLNLLPGEISIDFTLPHRMTLKQWVALDGFHFIGLHGGIGEDGTIQHLLARAHKPFNGPHAAASRLCMDKFATGQALTPLAKNGIYTAEKRVIPITQFKHFTVADYEQFWQNIKRNLRAPQKRAPQKNTLNKNTLPENIIIKPVDDGCSAGICVLTNAADLKTYLDYARRVPRMGKNTSEIPRNTLSYEHGIIEMPTHAMTRVMFERYIQTDKIRVIHSELNWTRRTNWIEITAGVIGARNRLHTLNPSLTVAFGHVLSLEEKFQGGTGINITPPPTPYVSRTALIRAKQRITLAAQTLGIEGYSRIDAFMHTQTGEVIIIEANTLPALTPSTVMFHQALAEPAPVYPRDFIEHLIALASKHDFQKFFTRRIASQRNGN